MLAAPPKPPARPEPSRDAGLARVAAFAPRAGHDYARERNHDRGPHERTNVSMLSPWLRHRLVLESEVAATVLARHDPDTARKFLQELCWRTYFKGFLELRPALWERYRAALDEAVACARRDDALAARVHDAQHGRSGIACMDQWSAELRATGYLHNHARMWFASIWIFTLELPWTLGADFFLRHLLDGDPASNTLSWRWVAGLHTRGKTYLARADNIARFTGGRVQPRERLARTARPVADPELPAPRTLPAAPLPDDAGRAGLLLTDEDVGPALPLPRRVVALAGLSTAAELSPGGVSPSRIAFAEGALRDGLADHGRRLGLEPVLLNGADGTDAALDWARSRGLDSVVVPWTPVGPARRRIDALAGALARSGIALWQPRRAWDEAFWPLATGGFFKLGRRIPEVLATLGVARGAPSWTC